MDMGIKGRKAIICAASKDWAGLRYGTGAEGVDLVINARNSSPNWTRQRREIRKSTGVKQTAWSTLRPGSGTQCRPRSLSGAGHHQPTTPADRRRATSATGSAMTGSRQSTPIC